MKSYVVKLLFLGLFLLGGKFSYAQILKGVVIDADTKKGIQNASVYSTDIELGTITNANGEFEISKFLQLNMKILVSALGYEKQVLLVSSDSMITILLEPQHTILEEVVVSTPTGKLQSENITYITSIKINGTNSIKNNMPIGYFTSNLIPSKRNCCN